MFWILRNCGKFPFDRTPNIKEYYQENERRKGPNWSQVLCTMEILVVQILRMKAKGINI